MAISFVTIKREGSGCNVVKETFPNIPERKLDIIFSESKYYKTYKAAKIAAKKFAEAQKIAFVPAGTSATTVTVCKGGYMSIILTPEGKILGQPERVLNLRSAFRQAEQEAKKNKFIFIKPDMASLTSLYKKLFPDAAKTSVITVAEYQGAYVPVEVTTKREVIGRGHLTPDFQSALLEAKTVAKDKKINFVETSADKLSKRE